MLLFLTEEPEIVLRWGTSKLGAGYVDVCSRDDDAVEFEDAALPAPAALDTELTAELRVA